MNSLSQNANTVDLYLQRIGLSNRAVANEEFLNQLQYAHLTHVPYENLDQLTHRAGTLSNDSLLDKIVTRHRGGYCFELNGAFCWLLRSLGYTVTEHFARWHQGVTLPIPMRRHRILVVSLGNRKYIADAGVGCRCPLTPLVLEPDTLQQRDGTNYRVVRDETFGWLVQIEVEGQMVGYFSFGNDAQYPIDFTYVHYYLTHHPQSMFLSKTMVHLPSACGRSSLADTLDPETGEAAWLFKSDRPDGQQPLEKLLRTHTELLAVLKETFSLDLPQDFFA